MGQNYTIRYHAHHVITQIGNKLQSELAIHCFKITLMNQIK